MSKKNKGEAAAKPKKPIYKKWWFWVIIAVIVIAAFGNSGGKDAEQPSATDAPPVAESTTPTEAPAEAAPAEADDGEDAAPAPSALDFDVTFSSSFRNDTTGKWRKALVATGEEIQEYALDYYREYFKADDEVHVIYNFSLNTVNCLNVFGNQLSVRITEYVDGEEHDAKKACGGLFLGEYLIDIESGDIIYNSFTDSADD